MDSYLTINFKLFPLKAMDAVTDFCQELGVAKLEKFMVAGASKRGWATWTTVNQILYKNKLNKYERVYMNFF